MTFKLIPAHLPALFFWFTEAATVFANGAISGLGGSGITGAGTGAFSANVEGGITPNSLNLALVAAALSALSNGVKRFTVWHDAHPIPNPFAPPANITNPPAQ